MCGLTDWQEWDPEVLAVHRPRLMQKFSSLFGEACGQNSYSRVVRQWDNRSLILKCSKWAVKTMDKK